MTQKEQKDLMFQMLDNIKKEMREEKDNYYEYECESLKDITREQIRCLWYKGLGLLGFGCAIGLIEIMEYDYFMKELTEIKKELSEDL